MALTCGPPDLSVEIAGMRWRTPITTASGTFAAYEDYARLLPLETFGAITLKSVTLEPRAGNPPPRLAEVPAGLLNSVGIQNPGIDRFLERELPRVRSLGLPVVVSIAGHTLWEYVELARRLSEAPGVDAIEINMSCPNVGKETLEFGQSPAEAAALVRAVRAATRLPLIAKLTPNVADPVPIARAAVSEGADALALINTLIGMALDIRTMLPKTGRLTAGLSGPAVKPIAVRMVWQVAEAVDVPIIGMGGITTAEDAIEFLLAGATAVALGTVTFVNPLAAVEVRDGLARYLTERGFTSVREIIGRAHREWAAHAGMERLHV